MPSTLGARKKKRGADSVESSASSSLKTASAHALSRAAVPLTRSTFGLLRVPNPVADPEGPWPSRPFRRSALSFAYSGRHSVVERLCCLAAILSCTKLPWSAGIGAIFRLRAGRALLPSLGPLHEAPGLVSNAFRRNAARPLVCTLPLLHFSLSRVAVVPCALRRSAPKPTRNSSSSAPAVRHPLRSRAGCVGPELPGRDAHSILDSSLSGCSEVPISATGGFRTITKCFAH